MDSRFNKNLNPNHEYNVSGTMKGTYWICNSCKSYCENDRNKSRYEAVSYYRRKLWYDMKDKKNNILTSSRKNNHIILKWNGSENISHSYEGLEDDIYTKPFNPLPEYEPLNIPEKHDPLQIIKLLKIFGHIEFRSNVQMRAIMKF